MFSVRKLLTAAVVCSAVVSAAEAEIDAQPLAMLKTADADATMVEPAVEQTVEQVTASEEATGIQEGDGSTEHTLGSIAHRLLLGANCGCKHTVAYAPGIAASCNCARCAPKRPNVIPVPGLCEEEEIIIKPKANPCDIGYDPPIFVPMPPKPKKVRCIDSCNTLSNMITNEMIAMGLQDAPRAAIQGCSCAIASPGNCGCSNIVQFKQGPAPGGQYNQAPANMGQYQHAQGCNGGCGGSCMNGGGNGAYGTGFSDYSQQGGVMPCDGITVNNVFQDPMTTINSLGNWC